MLIVFRFKNADKDFSAKHEAKSDLESYLHTCKSAFILTMTRLIRTR
jgi:hypothetical protein